MTGVLALNPQNLIAPAVNGGTLGFSLDTSPVEILPGNAQIDKLVFSNPGTGNIYVCQAFDQNGNAQTPGPNPGNWLLMPGASLAFTGNGVAGAWLAAAAGGSGNPLTVSGLPGAQLGASPVPPPPSDALVDVDLNTLTDVDGNVLMAA